MRKTKIEWCDYTWNPITGCSPISEGCEHCYAAALSRRFGWGWGEAVFHPERLSEPMKVKRPSRIFVCSMGDLFHGTVDYEWIESVFAAMEMADWHTYIVLTKRPGYMLDWLEVTEIFPDGRLWPNVWVGVTAETQALLEERWMILCKQVQPVRFVSVEPMLEPITFESHHVIPDWVIAGPETGPGARVCRDEWIDELAEQSPCFFDKRKSGWKRRAWPL